MIEIRLKASKEYAENEVVKRDAASRRLILITH